MCPCFCGRHTLGSRGHITILDQGCRAQSPALSKHHYLVKPSFFVPLAVLGQGGGGTSNFINTLGITNYYR